MTNLTNYTHPHVNISSKALQRRVPVAPTSTATTLLAPFVCDRGPENVLVPIDTYADFVATFGNLDYRKINHRQILNIQNWIGAGGRVLACRLSSDAQQKASSKKYFISVYNKTTKEVKTIGITADDLGTLYFKKDSDNESSHNNCIVNNILANYNTYTSESATTIAKYPFDDSNDINVYELTYTAKYTGTYYNNLEIEIERASTNAKSTYFNISVSYKDPVSENSTRLEYYRNKTFNDLATIPSISNFIGSIVINNYENNINDPESITKLLKTTGSGASTTFVKEFIRAPKYNEIDSVTFSIDTSAGDTAGTDLSDNYMNTTSIFSILKEILKQPLETPVDCFIDCGYPLVVKQELLKLFKTGDGGEFKGRDDIFVYFSEYEINDTAETFKKTNVSLISSDSDLKASGYNTFALIDQYDKIQYYPFDDSATQVFIPLTYYYAQKIPYYDYIDGPQYPLAGTKRGKINVVSIDSIPSNNEKQEKYDSRVNYAEKDSRGTYLMTNLTCDTDNTELKFINKSRALLKIKKELELIGREYLHEFNERVTKANLKNRLDSAVSAWILNKTLKQADIILYDYTDDDTLSNEEILINLNVVFYKTIEVISVDITVD